MQFSTAGLNLLKICEGCCLESYRDVAGIWTIGYGHTGPEVVVGLRWLQQQADDCLEKETGDFASRVERLISFPALTSNQFSALVIFSYNVGTGAFAHSTALKCVNGGNLSGVPAALLMWDVIHDPQTHQPVVSPGLRNRRLKEVALWNTSDGPTPQPVASGPPRPVMPPSDNTLRLGDTGEGVRILQALLAAHGYLVDSSFGPETANAVKTFQGSKNITPDGVVGPSTWAALIRP